ncbi:hypothetical protein [Deinococcus sp.]|uniref:hypothetical protein n=1 Tax=Deinococcus sp. TaxID=47478 RepID=UPI0025C17B31|nr:hypothetical protein [Deinococcus sp.]
MRPWMLTAPEYRPSDEEIKRFAEALAGLNPALLPPQTPKWVFLRWLSEKGYLLHGSQQPSISEFEPRTPHDLSGDEFSSCTGVFAASEGLWAMMYALRGPQVKRMVNAALQLRQASGLSDPYYFLSLAPRETSPESGRDLMAPGVVYVLPSAGFEPMPEYDWPGLGQVLEPQWICPHAVKPLFAVPVTSNDFPLPVRLHDADTVDARCAADPWGFPWLADDN